MTKTAQFMNHSAYDEKNGGTPPCLLGTGRYRMSEPGETRPICVQTWLLEIFITGQLQASIEAGAWHPFGRGQGVLRAPRTRHRERAARNCESICLFFDVGEGPAFEGWRTLDPPYRILDDPDQVIAPMSEEVHRHFGVGGADDVHAVGCFLQLLARLLKAEQRHETLLIRNNSIPVGDLVAQVHRFMHAHLDHALTLPEIAAAVGLSESGLAHAYKRLTGTSPMAGLRRMRVEVARFHLYDGRLSLAEIARRTGFADAFHLSRTFKQMIGVSPQAFRRGRRSPASRPPEASS